MILTLKYFQKNRLGQTKFLNVLQGDDWETAQIWYDAVKDFEFEGWGMGGINMCDMEVLLKRLIIMRDEKKLDGNFKNQFLRINEVAKLTSLSASTIRRAIAKGALKCSKRLGKLLFQELDIRRWING